MLMMSLCASGAQAQTVLKGTVHDSSGEPLVGVTVVMNGNSKTATVTDIDGRYSVNVGPKQKADYLSFSYVGMKPANVKIGGKSVIDVTLQDDNTNLADVIVVGYGTARKESLTGAVAAMKGDELLKGPSTNVSSLLGGKLPGISSVQTSGEPGNDQASLRIRGSRMEALYIVDGMPRSINDIDPNDIDRTTEIFNGEIGELHGVRFVETTEAKIFCGEDLAEGSRTLTVNGAVSGKNAVTFDGGTVKEGALAGRYILVGGQRAKVVSNTASVLTLDKNVTADDNAVIYPGEGGAEGCAVYGCLFVGKGAYGVVDLSEGTEVIVKPRGSSGTADPLDQRSSVGWKGIHAAAILYDEYMVRVECGSSYSGEDKAN